MSDFAAYSQNDEPPIWEILSDELNFSCRVWELRTRRYRHPRNGKEDDFYYLNSRDWVIVVARTIEGDFILVRQFRCGLNALSWELPGGIIDAGEDPIQAGLRELKEETGYVTEKGILIGACSPNPAILNNRCQIVFADRCQLSQSGLDWDEHEEMEIRTLSEKEVMQWVAENKISHALALVGILFYRVNVLKEPTKCS
ncbi:MAG: ADP-ribose pyrophosphatase [Opitutia bacterium UBA7350]|nr:MAG: ADP-ribose pyrophosphatase [Opitutae bacterium UBA7350]